MSKLDTAPAAKRGCSRLYTRSQWHKAARAVFDGREKATPAEVRKLRKRGRCQLRPRASLPLLRWHLANYRTHHLQQLELIYLTPYDCGAAGRFAIPCWIVERESRFEWTAYNPSSAARGPYQFVGWDVPWPVVTAADKLAHHRMAAELWAGGAGASHWACC